MPKSTIALKYRKFDRDNRQYRANYTSIASSGEREKWLLRLAMIHPQSRRLVKNAEIPGAKGKAADPYYLHCTCDTLEACFAALPQKANQLRLLFEQEQIADQRYGSETLSQNLWAAYCAFRSDFFAHQKRLYWHADSTLRNYQRRYDKMQPILSQYAVGDLTVATPSQSILDALSHLAAAESATVLSQQLLAHFARYLSFRLLIEVHPLLQQQFSIPVSRADKTRASFGLQRSLAEKDIQKIFETAMKHPESTAAFATAFNIISGLRTAECAALSFGSIEKSPRSGVSVVSIRAQLVGHGDSLQLIPRLKTDAAYREIVLPTLLADLFKKRQNWYIKRTHCTKTQLRCAPLFFDPDDLSSPLDASKLGLLVKEYLQQVICVDDTSFDAFSSMQQFEKLQQDREDSISFYLLRRSAITLLHTRIHLPASLPAEDAICYLAGHARTRTARKGMPNARPTPAWQHDFRQGLDQYLGVLLKNPPTHLLHSGSKINHSCFLGGTFMNKTSDAVWRISLSAAEPGTTLKLILHFKNDPVLPSAAWIASPPTDRFMQQMPVSYANWHMPARPDADELKQFIQDWPY